MSCHIFERLYISWVDNNIDAILYRQYGENVDIPLFARYCLLLGWSMVFQTNLSLLRACSQWLAVHNPAANVKAGVPKTAEVTF